MITSEEDIASDAANCLVIIYLGRWVLVILPWVTMHRDLGLGFDLMALAFAGLRDRC